MYEIAATPRPRWTDLPAEIRTRLGQALGSEPVGGTPVTVGFSNGFAGSVDLADGRRIFAKIVSASINPIALRDYRAEAAIVEQLPAELPVPPLLTILERDIEGVSWFAAAYAWLGGRPPDPREPDDLDLVIALTTAVAATDPAPEPGLPRMVDDGVTFDRWVTFDGALTGYPQWLAAHRAEVADVAAGWRGAAAGDALLHGDQRLDNMVIADGRAWAVDWPHACAGAGFVDALLMAPALAITPGGPTMQQWIDRHPLLSELPADRLESVGAAALGYFVDSSLQPPPPGLPTVRQFQRAQALVLIDWLRARWAG